MSQRSGEFGRRRSGFALLTVLFGLALVTALLSASLGLTSAHVKVAGFEARRQEERALALGAWRVAGTLAAAAQAEGAAPLAPEPVPLALDGGTVWVLIRDVGGLVDLNTASEALIARLVAGLGADPEPVVAAIAARRAGQGPFARVGDFAALAGVTPELHEAAAPFLTVYSGRRGIAPDSAPEGLLAALTGETGRRERLADAVPPAFRTPPTGRAFAVSAWPDGLDGRRHDAVIAITVGADYAMRLVEVAR